MAKFIVEIQEKQPLTKKEKKKLASALQEVLSDVSESHGFNSTAVAVKDDCTTIDDKIGMEVQVTISD